MAEFHSDKFAFAKRSEASGHAKNIFTFVVNYHSVEEEEINDEKKPVITLGLYSRRGMPFQFIVTKIGSSPSWYRIEMAVVFIKSLIGTILGISISLWIILSRFFIYFVYKKGGLDPPSTVLF